MTRIKALAATPDNVRRLIGPLGDFLARPGNENVARLALMAVTPIVKNDRNWAKVTGEFKALFPQNKYTMSFNNETLRRYAHATNAVRDPNLKAYVLLFAMHELEQRPELVHSSAIISTSQNIGRLIGSVTEYITSDGNVRALLEHEDGLDMAAALRNVSAAFRESMDMGSAFQELFDIGEKDDRGDTSYYVMYRYSTKLAEIVKTFIAIRTPRASEARCFVFTRVYLGAGNQKRISRGAVLKLKSCYYLVGGTATQTRYSAGKNEGFITVAIPTGAANPYLPWLISGVMLSNALGWQPIVGRCALIHIGFRSILEREVRDSNVAIGTIDGKDGLLQDISNLSEQYGFLARLGMTDKQVGEYVLNVINNMTQVDRTGDQKHGMQRSLSVEDGREPLS